LTWVVRFVALNGVAKIDIDIINFTFFVLDMLLHGSQRSFAASVKQGVGATFGVMIQFPLYAGAFGVISNSGLTSVMTHRFLSMSTAGTYSWIIMIYTTTMEFFVAPGESKVVIETPYSVPAGQQWSVPAADVINADSAGGQLANLICHSWLYRSLRPTK